MGVSYVSLGGGNGRERGGGGKGLVEETSLRGERFGNVIEESKKSKDAFSSSPVPSSSSCTNTILPVLIATVTLNQLLRYDLQHHENHVGH